MSKIDISAEPLCNDLMPGKLQLVIQGDRRYFCFASAGSATVSAARHALYGRFSSVCNRQADTTKRCHDCLPFITINAILELAKTIIVPIALAVRLAHRPRQGLDTTRKRVYIAPPACLRQAGR